LVVREALQREGIEAYPFDVSVLRQMEQQDKQEYRLPWAVIGSTDAHLDAGATVYLRKYPWGNALSSEPAHSDLPALRNMIMWSGQWHDLKMATRAKYEAWRAQRPLRKRSEAAIATAGRALVAKVNRVVSAIAGAWRATKRAGAAACCAVGVPPRFGARALLVLLLALSISAGPSAVRWATGTDLSATRKLALARGQVEQLVLEKARLVERYEKELNTIRLRLHDSQSSGELHVATHRAHEVEKAELLRNVRAASTRAELAETALRSATTDCTLWNPLVAGAKAASSKVSGAVAGATEQVVQSSRLLARDAGEAVVGLAKETPSFLSHATGRTVEISKELCAAHRLTLTPLTHSHASHSTATCRTHRDLQTEMPRRLAVDTDSRRRVASSRDSERTRTPQTAASGCTLLAESFAPNEAIINGEPSNLRAIPMHGRIGAQGRADWAACRAREARVELIATRAVRWGIG
jgi:septin family protein